MLKTIRKLGVSVSLLFDKSKVEAANKAIKDMAGGLKGVGLAVSGASGALFGMAGITSHHSRELEQNSESLGVNVERLQELQYAAQVAAGVTKDELGGALEGLSKTLFEARNNNVDAARTLIRLGIPLDMVRDKSISADQVLLSLADRFKDLPNGMYKTALASEALGGSGAKLLPLLNKGAQGIAAMGKEGRSLGVVLSEGAVKQGAEFDRQWTKVWLVLKNISYLIGNQLIKYLRPFVMEFQKFVVSNRQFIALGLATVFKSLGYSLELVFKTVKFMGERFKFLIEVLGGLERVSRVIAIVLSALVAGRLVASIGTLILSFRSLASVIGVIASPAALIGAAFLALFLVIQDLFSNDSLIKEWFNKLSNMFPNLSKLLKGIVAEITTIPDRLGDAWEWVKESFDSMSESLGAFFDQFSVLSTIKASIKDAFGSLATVGGWLGKLLPSAQTIGGFGEGLSGDAASYTQNKAQAMDQAKYQTAHPSWPGGSSGGDKNENNLTNNVNANFNITVPHGTSPASATEMVSEGTEKALNQVLRQTRDQHLGGRAH